MIGACEDWDIPPLASMSQGRGYLALPVDDGELRDAPAIVRAADLELHHRDGVCRAADNAQSAADALLLVDDHVGAAFPGFRRQLVQRIALHHAGKPLHADAVVRADVHTATAEDADRRVDHDVELALQAAPRLRDGLLRTVASLGLGGDAEALL